MYSKGFLVLSGIVRKITAICVMYKRDPENPKVWLPDWGFPVKAKSSRYMEKYYILYMFRKYGCTASQINPFTLLLPISTARISFVA
ncbi:MAG: hypothetical protein K2H64_01240 [Desulfovibrio sp.]|nr:hypothetical protein [Desulfovibrio sp.]